MAAYPVPGEGRTPHVSEAVANEESRAERNASYEGDTELAGAIAILVQAAEARDPYGGNHPRSVSRLALRLDSKMGLARPHLDTLAVGALLHDVGKIGIPYSILLKPGRLTDGEYEIVERHSLLGVQVLESIGELSSYLPLVRHHHERFDGGGYPDGLKGKSIPLLARITFVVDAFDSIARDRSYRHGASQEHALGEILRNSGTQFDPEVVGALARLLKRGSRQSSSAG